jgi:hypothetical protein
MRFAVLGALPAVLLAACEGGTTAPQSATTNAARVPAVAFTVSQVFPFELATFVPCAAGGAGEVVVLTGALHDVFHLTLTPSGHATVRFHDNPQGVTGTGLTTGAAYRAVGVTQETMTVRIGSADTFVNSFHVIGRGPASNFTVHETLHLTVNANGTVTASFDHLRIACR